MGSSHGALVTAARRVGISPEEYAQHVADDGKWCYRCRAWHPIDDFGQDASRTDGRWASCRESRNRVARARYATRAGQPA